MAEIKGIKREGAEEMTEKVDADDFEEVKCTEQASEKQELMNVEQPNKGEKVKKFFADAAKVAIGFAGGVAFSVGMGKIFNHKAGMDVVPVVPDVQVTNF